MVTKLCIIIKCALFVLATFSCDFIVIARFSGVLDPRNRFLTRFCVALSGAIFSSTPFSLEDIFNQSQQVSVGVESRCTFLDLLFHKTGPFAGLDELDPVLPHAIISVVRSSWSFQRLGILQGRLPNDYETVPESFRHCHDISSGTVSERTWSVRVPEPWWRWSVGPGSGSNAWVLSC